MKKYTSYGRSKRPKRREYTRVNKDLAIRGGFVTKMPNPPTPRYVYTSVSKRLGSGPQAVNKGRSFVASMANAKAALDVAGKTIDVVSQVRALGQSGDTTAVSHTSSVGVPNPNSSIGRRFTTKFDVGQPSSRIVNEKARSNGTRKLTQYDTSTSDQDPTSASRQSLTLTTGANQKSVFGFDSRSYWTLGDLEDLVDADLYTRSTNQAQTAYWMTKYFGTKLKIMNTNKFLKMKIKVHWLKPNQTSFSPKAWLSDCVETGALPTAASTDVDLVPYNLQLTAATNATERFDVALDPQLGSMRKSKLFDILFDVPKYFQKTLEPGETWELDYCHHTGPGIRLNDLISTEDNATWDENAAAFYYPLIEVVGSQVEIVDSQNRDSSFIVTSSGAVQMEMKKYCEIVLADTSPASIYASSSGGFTKNRWDYRVFTDFSTTLTDGTGIVRRFNVDYNNILKAGEPDGLGKFIIPVTSDTQKVRGGRSNDGA